MEIKTLVRHEESMRLEPAHVCDTRFEESSRLMSGLDISRAMTSAELEF